MLAAAALVASRPSQLRINVGGFAQAIVRAGRMVYGIRKSVSQFLVHFAIHIGLNGKHILRSQFVAALEGLVDPLNAIGVAPLQSQQDE
jgi:hypothetical protein